MFKLLSSSAVRKPAASWNGFLPVVVVVVDDDVVAD